MWAGFNYSFLLTWVLFEISTTNLRTVISIYRPSSLWSVLGEEFSVFHNKKPVIFNNATAYSFPSHRLDII